MTVHDPSTQRKTAADLSRRLFLWSGVGLSAPLANTVRVKNETVYHFVTPECDVRMTVEFYDGYSSDGFWFSEHRTDRQYCFSRHGEEGRNCLTQFSGSIAIARYRIRSRSHSPDLLILREHVRTNDQDNRFNSRPPFERALEIREGLASDIQAFGYEGDNSPAHATTAQPSEPWFFMRQDLYLASGSAPFLVVHWKHTLSAIRLLDVIPGADPPHQSATVIEEGGR